METQTRPVLTVVATVNAPVEKVWNNWNEPAHIQQWNQASPDWHCPHAENDLRPGGRLKATMAAKDGSFSFDFEGIYDQVEPHKHISYALGDGRKVKVQFEDLGNQTRITESFEAESENPLEMQQGGWQAILDSFKKYTES